MFPDAIIKELQWMAMIAYARAAGAKDEVEARQVTQLANERSHSFENFCIAVEHILNG